MTNPEFLEHLKELICRAEHEEKYIDYLVNDVVELLGDYEEDEEC